MGISFVFGPAQSGKSRHMQREMAAGAAAAPERNFFLLTPDQYSMQSQKELLALCPGFGMMNMEALNFQRLGHRLLEEAGGLRESVLDDLGKVLVLQKVATSMAEELPFLGRHLGKWAYMEQAKSALSEFMQYGLSPRDVEAMADICPPKGVLQAKLRDLSRLYLSFLEFTCGRFTTAEQRMATVEACMPRSALLRGAAVYVDGFTDFTPPQISWIGAMAQVADQVKVALVLGEGESAYGPVQEQNLYYLSQKTLALLEGEMERRGISRDRRQDVFLTGASPGRGCSSWLIHLEKSLFAPVGRPMEGKPEDIRLAEAANPKEECLAVGAAIVALSEAQGWKYRDMAIICGDLEVYAPYLEDALGGRLPLFFDRMGSVRHHPLFAWMRGALLVLEKDFSYDSVFYLLRNGLCPLDAGDVDVLDNYILATGQRGYRAWSREFGDRSGRWQAELENLNLSRQRMMDMLSPLLSLRGAAKAVVGEWVESLYGFLVKNQIQQKLTQMQEVFLREGDNRRALDYGQVYVLAVDMLQSLYDLLGEESLSSRDFLEILEAGFGELRAGALPRGRDALFVGDVERSRLRQVKAVFFIGANDIFLSGKSSHSGLLSDMDREFLRDARFTLAPSPRERMWMQRLHLYLRLSKPSRHLYISYARSDAQGEPLRPAYVVGRLRRIFPDLTPERAEGEAPAVASPGGALFRFSRILREWTEGEESREAESLAWWLRFSKEPAPLEAYYLGRPAHSRLWRAAFMEGREGRLSKAAGAAVYGRILQASVSRLECFAACAYKHFLQYALALREREEYVYEPVDMGRFFHGVLEDFDRGLQADGLSWAEFGREEAGQRISRAVERLAGEFGQGILHSNARYRYGLARMEALLSMTVLGLQAQLRQGEFRPIAAELAFGGEPPREGVGLVGRIDRVDTAEIDGKIYVKVVDYKSGKREFSLSHLYAGLQLQLAMYLNKAMEALERAGGQAAPAAMLYYHIHDPLVDTGVELAPDELQRQLQEELRMDGWVNAGPEVLSALDRQNWGKSAVVPVRFKKDGSLYADSKALPEEDLVLLTEFVEHKARQLGRTLLEGGVEAAPCRWGQYSACSFCAYKNACHFDAGLPGYGYWEPEAMDRESALERMRQALDKDGAQGGEHGHGVY